MVLYLACGGILVAAALAQKRKKEAFQNVLLHKGVQCATQDLGHPWAQGLQYNIRLPLVISSAFLKEITKTKSSANFVSPEPNGHGLNLITLPRNELLSQLLGGLR